MAGRVVAAEGVSRVEMGVKEEAAEMEKVGPVELREGQAERAGTVEMGGRAAMPVR